MPFTFSHPAAVLPFWPLSGKHVSMTALVLGSMAPDFEFFFRMRAESDISHSWLGAFVFNVPMVVALAFLYHGWVREPLFLHLPLFLRKRVGQFSGFNWASYFRRHWGMVLVSALVGVVTHYFCDAFTHDYGWFVHRIPFLASFFEIGGKTVPVYHGLQYLSSLLMGGLLLIALMRLPVTKFPVTGGSPLFYWGTATVIAAGALITRLILRDIQIETDDFIMSLMASGLLGVVIASLVSRWWVRYPLGEPEKYTISEER